MREYEAEVKKRYGDTVAYQEYQEKTKDYTEAHWQEAKDGMNKIFARFAAYMQSGYKIDCAEVQTLVNQLKNHITVNYYTCTDEMLSGLGQTYVADPRFQNNLDQFGVGTAEFISAAIKTYCKRGN